MFNWFVYNNNNFNNNDNNIFKSLSQAFADRLHKIDSRFVIVVNATKFILYFENTLIGEYTSINIKVQLEILQFVNDTLMLDKFWKGTPATQKDSENV